MRFYLNHTIILILAVCCCINSYATTDSLPTCIKHLAKGNIQSYTEYDYNGKRLFSFAISPKNKPINYYDSLGSIRFYDSSCKLFCTWMVGGIMGSKMIPYSIEKQQIVTLRVVTFDSIPKREPLSSNNLPDSIAKLALKKNSHWIEETIYDGNRVYRFQDPSDKSSKITFVNPYFDENGSIVSPVRFMRRAFWWHQVNGKFSRTQFRPGYR